jgi:tetratricopeptide (TPR) repeat protein
MCLYRVHRDFGFTTFYEFLDSLNSFCLPTIRFTLAPTLEEKQRYTSSIIRVLEDDDDLRMSTANVRARIYQAEILSELGIYQEAIDEVTKSIQQLSSPSLIEIKTKFHDILLAKAYRVAADVYELSGNYVAAIESIQRMAATNPEMRTKVVKELDRLKQRATAA